MGLLRNTPIVWRVLAVITLAAILINIRVNLLAASWAIVALVWMTLTESFRQQSERYQEQVMEGLQREADLAKKLWLRGYLHDNKRNN